MRMTWQVRCQSLLNWRKLLNELSLADNALLDHCEKVIGQAREAYVEAGKALALIRDRRLYRDRFADFASYCKEVWGWHDRNYADKLIRASEAAEIVIAEMPEIPPPENEGQARELAMLLEHPEAIAATWAIVTQAADELNNGKITAKLIKSVVSTVKEAVVTGAYEDGSGEQHTVSDVMRSKLTRDAYEAMQQQRDKIIEKNAPPLLKNEFTVTEHGIVLLTDLPAHAKVKVIVYHVEG